MTSNQGEAEIDLARMKCIDISRIA